MTMGRSNGTFVMRRESFSARYSSMGGPTMPDPNGSTTVDSSSRDKPTSLG